MTLENPVQILVFSGKRKSGKDYITELLQRRLGVENCSILRLSAPLKSQYAKEHSLNFERLLDASEYKEKYRADMIRWGEEKRNENPAYFCDIITQGPGSERKVWIISDARRKTDILYFKEKYKESVLSIRVVASQEVRKERGWVFTTGIDDAESECGLDSGVTFDVIIENNGDNDQLERVLNMLLEKINNISHPN